MRRIIRLFGKLVLMLLCVSFIAVCSFSLSERMMPLFYQVMNMSITACYVFVILFLCRLLLRKAPKIYSYVLWLVLLFRLLCPVALPSPISVLNLLNLENNQNQTVMEYISPDIEVAEEPTVDLGIASLSEQINQRLPAPKPGHSATFMMVQVFIHCMIWIFGMLCFVAYALFSTVRLRKLTYTAVRIAPGIYESECLPSPFVTGLFSIGSEGRGLFGTGFLQAKIYLPSHMSEEEKQIVLAHERTHLKRLDPLVKGLFFVALALHWFNPLVWVAFFIMNRDMEMSCDEAVLQEMKTVGDGRRETVVDRASRYSEVLLSMASAEAGLKKVSPLGPLAFGESSVAARIKNALKYRPSSFRAKMVLAVVCVAVMLACSCNPSTDSGGSFPLTVFWTANNHGESLAVDQMWEHRTPYIGDNSAVGNLLGTLEVPEELKLVSEGMQLYTSQRPYRLIIRYQTDHPDVEAVLRKDSVWIYRNMALLFAAIDNADIIETQISYGDDEILYCMMTRFEAFYPIDGNMTDLLISTREDWDTCFEILHMIDFRIHGITVSGYDETFANRHYIVVTLDSFDKTNERMLVSGNWQGQNGQSTSFYMEMEDLVYDEYGDYMLIEELQPGDRLLVGYVAAEDGVPLSEVVYKQKVPAWFAVE